MAEVDDKEKIQILEDFFKSTHRIFTEVAEYIATWQKGGKFVECPECTRLRIK